MTKIVTLGDFDIIIKNKSIIKEIGSSQNIMTLFKYFLIHKDTKLLVDTIINDLFSDEEFKNPINVIRTQISRLRKIITSNNIAEKSFFNIDYINGYYVFTLVEDCEVDFIDFEKVLDKDYISLKEYINKKPYKVKDTLLLYKGEFLGEIGNENWMIPVRSKYDRLYLKGLSYYIDYLKENKMNTEIVEICEKVINIKPYEEFIHINFIEALLELKQNSYAMIHYEFFTKKILNDLNIKPSKNFQQVYKKIRAEEESYSNIDLNIMDNEMVKEFDNESMIFCDIEYFRYLYNYERRNVDRHLEKDKGTGIGVITIYNKEQEQLTEEELKKAIEQLRYVLGEKLRQGDIASKWNKSQTLIILYGLKENHIESVIDKISNTFNSIKFDEGLSLNIKLKIL